MGFNVFNFSGFRVVMQDDAEGDAAGRILTPGTPGRQGEVSL